MSTREAMDIIPDECGEKSDTESKKLCAVCNTANTPLWRSGPYGPKSLCNACGIKFRKKKGSSALELKKEPSNTKKDQSSSSTTSTGTGCGGKKGNDGKNNVSSRRGKDGKLGSKLKERLMGLGKEVVLLKRPRSPMKRQWSGKKKAGEVEQAAALLMALSCASVYA